MRKKNTVQKKVSRNLNTVGDQMAAAANQNFQTGTNVTIGAAEDLAWKSGRLTNVGYEQGKGNLFEYIEAAKLEREIANKTGSDFGKIVTDLPGSRGGFGEPIGPVDFRVVQNGRVLFEGQAKVNNNPYDTAENFLNPKYDGMQKITTSDNYEATIRVLDEKLAKGEITKARYDEVTSEMRPGLTDDSTGISSGGTTSQELEQFRGADGKVNPAAVEEYAQRLKIEQMQNELGEAAKKGAVAGAVMGFVVAGVKEIVDVYKGRKDGKEAVKNVLKGTAKGGARGAAVGSFATVVRIAAQGNSVSVLAEGNAATAMASGIVDCGISLYAYTKGEISGDVLVQDVKRSIISSSSAWYFTTAVKAAIGTTAGGILLPMTVYAVTSSMLMATKAIIDQAKLNAEEHRRAAALLKEETATLKEYGEKLAKAFNRYRSDRKAVLEKFISDFDRNAFEDPNYPGTINSLIELTENLQIPVRYKEYSKFEAMMTNDDIIPELG